jgi:hypothetical protein
MREEQLIAEILHNKSLGEDVNIALAEYLTAQARYIRALAERKEIEVEFIKNPPPEPEPIPKKVPKKVGSDMPW